MADSLRDSGPQLRQDDPSALKDIIQIVQSKTSGVEMISKYVKFFIGRIQPQSKSLP